MRLSVLGRGMGRLGRGNLADSELEPFLPGDPPPPEDPDPGSGDGDPPPPGDDSFWANTPMALGRDATTQGPVISGRFFHGPPDVIQSRIAGSWDLRLATVVPFEDGVAYRVQARVSVRSNIDSQLYTAGTSKYQLRISDAPGLGTPGSTEQVDGIGTTITFTGTTTVDAVFVWFATMPYFGILGQDLAENTRLEYQVFGLEKAVIVDEPLPDGTGFFDTTALALGRLADTEAAVAGGRAIYASAGVNTRIAGSWNMNDFGLQDGKSYKISGSVNVDVIATNLPYTGTSKFQFRTSTGTELDNNMPASETLGPTISPGVYTFTSGTQAFAATFIHAFSRPYLGILGQDLPAGIRLEWTVTSIAEVVPSPLPWEILPVFGSMTLALNGEHVGVNGTAVNPVYIPPGATQVHIPVKLEATVKAGYEDILPAGVVGHTAWASYGASNSTASGGFSQTDIIAPSSPLFWRPGDDPEHYASVQFARAINTVGARIKVGFSGSGIARGGYGVWVEVKEGAVNALPNPLPTHRGPYLLNLGAATLVNTLDIENMRITDSGFAQDDLVDPRGYINSPTAGHPSRAACWRATLAGGGYSQLSTNGENGLYSNTDVVPEAITPHTIGQDADDNWYLKLHSARFPTPVAHPDFPTVFFPFQAAVVNSGKLGSTWNHKSGVWRGTFTIPSQSGAWSAFWIVGIRTSTGASLWPPEVDFFEHFNAAFGATYTQYDTSGTQHVGVHGSNKRARALGGGGSLKTMGWSDETNLWTQKHTWTCVRDASTGLVTWFIDDVEYNQCVDMLFPTDGNEDYGFQVIMNVAVRTNDANPYDVGTTDMYVWDYKYYSTGYTFDNYTEDAPYPLRTAGSASVGPAPEEPPAHWYDLFDDWVDYDLGTSSVGFAGLLTGNYITLPASHTLSGGISYYFKGATTVTNTGSPIILSFNSGSDTNRHMVYRDASQGVRQLNTTCYGLNQVLGQWDGTPLTDLQVAGSFGNYYASFRFGDNTAIASSTTVNASASLINKIGIGTKGFTASGAMSGLTKNRFGVKWGAGNASTWADIETWLLDGGLAAAGVTWTAGASTTLTSASTTTKITRNGGNPSASTPLTSLTIGTNYTVRVVIAAYTASGTTLIEVDTAANLAGTTANSVVATGVGTWDVSFIATANTHYLGMTATAGTNGQYVEFNTVYTRTTSSGTAWTQGTNTVRTETASRVRATRKGGNPRVVKQVSGLTVGHTYKFVHNFYAGTASGDSFFRVSSNSDLTSSDYGSSTMTASGLYETTFTAASGSVYYGLVVTAAADGQYAEAGLTYTLTDTTAAVDPVITSSSTATVNEGSILSHALTADQTVTYSITGGADQARYSIAGSTLTLPAKEYANPDDADLNNTYIVNLSALNASTGLSGGQTFTATVADVVGSEPAWVTAGGFSEWVDIDAGTSSAGFASWLSGTRYMTLPSAPTLGISVYIKGNTGSVSGLSNPCFLAINSNNDTNRYQVFRLNASSRMDSVSSGTVSTSNLGSWSSTAAQSMEYAVSLAAGEQHQKWNANAQVDTTAGYAAGMTKIGVGTKGFTTANQMTNFTLNRLGIRNGAGSAARMDAMTALFGT